MKTIDSNVHFFWRSKWSLRCVLIACVLLFLSGGHLVSAQQTAPEQVNNWGSLAQYQVCLACHGSDGVGNEVLGSPTLAGSSAWYLQRQLENFKSGIRGSHSNDQLGKQMAGFAVTLSEEDIVTLATYVAAMASVKQVPTIEGDLAKGQQLYIICGSCHGAKGQGNKALNSPQLIGLNDWYIVRQLQHFKSGVRGQHEADKYGLQMSKMAQMLVDDQAIRDVAAYIARLSLDKPS